jgi:hypothetical protein
MAILAHKYAVGERVVFSSKQLVKVAPGHYEVRALLPLDRGRLQYRLKSELERYERVVSEDELALIERVQT